MPSINKILDKVNQASQAVKSAKGIKAQIESAGYKGGVNTEEVDKLQEQAESNRRDLEKRRESLQKQVSSAAKTKSTAKKKPEGPTVDLQYPLDGDMDNWMIFKTRLRKPREGGNLLSDTPVEIALYLPEDGWSQTSAVSYKDEGIGAFARGVVSSLEGGGTSAGMIDEALNAAVGFVQNALGSMGGGVGNLKAGRATNPMKEQLLEEVAFREHQFTFTMMPKSKLEADQCIQIIHAFRVAMLPDTFAGKDNEEKSSSENFFNYPNVFDVEIDGPLSNNMERFLPMVMKSLEVKPMGTADYILAEDDSEDWYSGHIELELVFAEIKVMTQEVYEGRVAAVNTVGKLGQGISDFGGSPSILDSDTQKQTDTKHGTIPAADDGGG